MGVPASGLPPILEDSHVLGADLLQPGDGVLQLLDLGLQLNHVAVGGKGGRCKEQRRCESGYGDDADRRPGKGKRDIVFGHGK